MTEEQKVNSKRFSSEAEKDLLISRILECPAELSDSEVAQILEDDELRDIYNISVDVRAAKRHTEVDAAAEWERFRPRLTARRRPALWWPVRVAAAMVGILLVSAALLFVSHREASVEQPLMAKTEIEEPTVVDVIAATPANPEAAEAPPTPAPEPARTSRQKSKPAEALTVSEQIARAKQSADLEEYLRVQQARMDNDLAMQRAKSVINQYYAIAEMYGDSQPLQATGISLGDGFQIDEELVSLIIP